MDNFKEASKLKLKFQTNKGLLTTEQLWDLTVVELDVLAVELDDKYKNSKSKSFIERRSSKNAGIKLQFDIVYEVLVTKQEEEAAATQAKEDKEHNKRIIELIAEKKDGELKTKSIKELEAMMR